MKRIIMLLVVISAILVNALTGCTSIGATGVLPEMNMGPNVDVNIAVYKDKNVSDERANSITTAIHDEFLQYGLNIKVAEVKEWKRPAFTHKGIFEDIARRPLVDVDRNIALVGRDARDFLWGMLLPEAGGATELWTRTRGYVVAEIGSLNQALMLQSPQAAAVHEFYHMLGIDHYDGRKLICEKIIRLKQAAIKNREGGNTFFPGVDEHNKLVLTRAKADRRFGIK